MTLDGAWAELGGDAMPSLDGGPTLDGGVAPSCSQGSLATNDSLATNRTPRPGYGGRKVRLANGRSYVMSSIRDASGAEAWRLSVYRLSTRDLLWQYQAASSEMLSDFAVHPSGEVTLASDHLDESKRSFELTRLDPSGGVTSKMTLASPATIPSAELGILRPEAFSMSSEGCLSEVDQNVGWIRVASRGEDVVTTFLSIANVSDSGKLEHYVSGLMSLRWSGAGFEEEWAHVVDGSHQQMWTAWVYDEFGWNSASYRPLLSVTEDRRIVVGRSWNSSACSIAHTTFGDVDASVCQRLPNAGAEWQPFAITWFSANGARETTQLVKPPDMQEFVVFDMDASGDRIALAGSAIPAPGGNIAYYAAAPGEQAVMLPYDGYLAVVDRSRGLVFERLVDLGRGDLLASVRWAGNSLITAGASDWDRWNGGMSISRGSDATLVFADMGTGQIETKRIASGSKDRHTHLLSVDALPSYIVGVGLDDAPMTHSGDGEAKTYGGLTVEVDCSADRTAGPSGKD